MENKNNFNKVSGFSDIFSDELSLTQKLDSKFFNFTALWGYEKIETPIIEKSSIFSRKTGSSIGSNIYNFTDPSGLDVSLRADFTTSIMRSYLENNFTNNEMRFSYSGEIYRYDGDINNNYSRQNGVELIGSSNIYSDLEIIAMSKIFLSSVIHDDIKISMGHVGILQDVIKYFELNDRIGLFLLQNIDFIKNESSNEQIISRAEEHGIFFDKEVSVFNSSSDDISSLLNFAFHKDSKFQQTRNSESIINGLMNKLSKNISKSKFSECLDVFRNLVNINGDLDYSISEANKILSNIPVKSNLKSLYDLVNNLNYYEIDDSDVLMNFGLVREWGYYTGFVFDIYNGENVILGGGGRYDSLGNSLGESLPAAGFAVDSEKIISNNNKSIKNTTNKKITVFINDEKDLNEAIMTCKEERSRGNIVSLKSSFANLDDAKKWSANNEVSEIIFFENNKIIRSEIKLG